MLLHAPYVQLYSRQVVKQADLVLAMHWCGEAFTAEQKARNVDYYEQRTVRDSSLSACTQAVMCAEVGHLHLAHRYAREAALVDLRDLHRNSADGVHIASLAGAWSALVAGFGGLRIERGRLRIDPALPPAISRLSFRLRWQGQRLCVRVDRDWLVLEAPDAPVQLSVGTELVEVTPDAPLRRPLRLREPLLPAPDQPPGREPPHVEEVA